MPDRGVLCRTAVGGNECPYRNPERIFTGRAFARAIGLPETAFTAALTAPHLAGQSRVGLDEARRTVTHDARVST